MDPIGALLGFTTVAVVITLTPGVDATLVLRTAIRAGRGPAVAAGLGIVLGLTCWGVVTAVGVGMLLLASPTAFLVLRILGGVYLLWLGLTMCWSAWRGRGLEAAPPARQRGWFLQGLLTNLLNPKMLVLYGALLPPFVPDGGSPLSYGLLYTGIHAACNLVWLTALAFAGNAARRWLARPGVLRVVDAVAGIVLLGFAAGLLLSHG